MKKWIAFVLILCLIFSLSACASYSLNEHGLPVISSSLRNKLNKALKEHDERFSYAEAYLEIWCSEEDYEACEAGRMGLLIRYYGNYDGYDIVFYDRLVQVMVEETKQIGGYSFMHGMPFSIVGHKDGVTHDLEELYENGKISKESLEKIYQCHQAFLALYLGQD